MKKGKLLAISLLYLIPAFAQVDFGRMQQEYISRKPALDKMYAYPAIPFDSLFVTNKDGINISFWWMPGGGNKGTTLLVHGFMMNKSQMLSRAMVYYDLGYNVLAMDLRARGQSGGNAATSGPEIRSDVIAVMDYYANNLKGYGPLALVGYSHGGRAIVFAAEEKPDLVKTIILECIPFSLTESFKRIYKVDPPPIPEGDIEKAFQSISKIPVLLMIGDKDSAIIPEEGLKIKKTFGNTTSQLIVFEGAVHDLSLEKYRPLYIGSIESFLLAGMK